jgi:hypothetical protein
VKHWDLEGDLFLRINDFWMRLRRSTLSKHSEWFSDVFAAIEEGRLMPDPKWPYMDGKIILVDVKNVQRCFHVPALGVTAMDFDLLLTALDHAMYVSKPQCLISLDSASPAHTATSLLRFPSSRRFCAFPLS